MIDFRIKFHRYENGRSMFSQDWFTQAEDIRDALAKADLFIRGMKEGGITSDLAVVEIEARGYRGSAAQSGVSLFEGWEPKKEEEGE